MTEIQKMVEMIASVGGHVAGQRYRLSPELAEHYLTHGYAKVVVPQRLNHTPRGGHRGDLGGTA